MLKLTLTLSAPEIREAIAHKYGVAADKVKLDTKVEEDDRAPGYNVTITATCELNTDARWLR